MPAYNEGDTVRYKPVGGPQSRTSTTGVIRSVSTLTDRQMTASSDEPRYEIENSNTHKRTAVKESSIIGPAE